MWRLFIQTNDTYTLLSAVLMPFSSSSQDASQKLYSVLRSQGSVPTPPYRTKGGSAVSGENMSGLCLWVTEGRDVSIRFRHPIVVAFLGRTGSGADVNI